VSAWFAHIRLRNLLEISISYYVSFHFLINLPIGLIREVHLRKHIKGSSGRSICDSRLGQGCSAWAPGVNVDFPSWMISRLNFEANRLGVPRQSLIKVWIAERLAAAKK
jgi:hypothetical protein